jgi:RND family efflux transporter MFP subunit
MNLKWLVCLAAATWAGAFAGSVWAGEPEPAGPFQGITRPSERRQLSLKVMDVVWDVLVKPGDAVRTGQLLVIEDRREEELNYRIIKIEAESEARIKGGEVAVKAAEVTLENKQVELQRVQQMYGNGVATVTELDRARLDVEISKLEIEKARWDLEQARVERAQRIAQAERQLVTLDRMQVTSPIDGLVEDVLVRKGEVVDPQKPVIIVVKNDPLWVEVYLPTGVSLGLQVGQTVTVRYAFDPRTREARVIYLNPVADAAAGVQLVRLELANPEGLPSGLPVQVLPPAVVARGAAAGQQPGMAGHSEREP